MLRVLVLLAAVAVLAAGCGGKKENPTTAWASDLCTSISTWEDSMTSGADSLKGGNLTTQSFRKAANDVNDATNKLSRDVQKLGKPPTESGAQAQKAVDDLSSQVKTGLNSITEAANNAKSLSDVLAAVSTASAAFSTLTAEVQS